MSQIRTKLARRRLARAPIARRVRHPIRPVSVVVILSTAPKADAASIAKALVCARVAACVNVVPGVRSTYRWKGRVVRASEVLLVVKTSAKSRRSCVAKLGAIHPYEVPEIVVLRVDRAPTLYAHWIEASTA